MLLAFSLRSALPDFVSAVYSVPAFCNTVKIKRSECDGNCILPWISEVQIGYLPLCAK